MDPCGTPNNLDCNDNTAAIQDSTTYYADIDEDGYGDPNNTLISCNLPAGYITDGTDCNDLDLDIYPGAPDILGNGIDENCDGMDNYAGMNEVDLTVGVSPNPSVGAVQIQGPWSTFDVSVTDLTGKVIYEKKGYHSEDVVSTHGWAPATYFVTVSNQGKMAVAKLVVR